MSETPRLSLSEGVEDPLIVQYGRVPPPALDVHAPRVQQHGEQLWLQKALHPPHETLPLLGDAGGVSVSRGDLDHPPSLQTSLDHPGQVLHAVHVHGEPPPEAELALIVLSPGVHGAVLRQSQGEDVSHGDLRDGGPGQQVHRDKVELVLRLQVPQPAVGASPGRQHLALVGEDHGVALSQAAVRHDAAVLVEGGDGGRGGAGGPVARAELAHAGDGAAVPAPGVEVAGGGDEGGGEAPQAELGDGLARGERREQGGGGGHGRVRSNPQAQLTVGVALSPDVGGTEIFSLRLRPRHETHAVVTDGDLGDGRGRNDRRWGIGIFFGGGDGEDQGLRVVVSDLFRLRSRRRGKGVGAGTRAPAVPLDRRNGRHGGEKTRHGGREGREGPGKTGSQRWRSATHQTSKKGRHSSPA
mmetsp:Transcript_12901/g.28504  ORF Transcript_12901/g.28504 Transcript_12901/m.28504 type:complete len:412 (-) Transcript_12901:9-1244(-)